MSARLLFAVSHIAGCLQRLVGFCQPLNAIQIVTVVIAHRFVSFVNQAVGHGRKSSAVGIGRVRGSHHGDRICVTPV